MSVYKDIVTTAQDQNWNVKYMMAEDHRDPGKHSLRLEKSWNPISIKEVEWLFIREFVRRHELSRGYELATGVGLSCIAAGIGMKESGVESPRLLTMDAYIEENRHSSLSYAHDLPECYQDADGFKSVTNLIRLFDLGSIVFPCVGWSPTDTVDRLSTRFDLENGERLDYVFIDGQHYIDSIIADLDAVLPYVDRDRYAIFLHDTHAPNLEPALGEYLNLRLGRSYVVCPGCGVEDGGYNLSIITNLEEVQSDPALSTQG